LVGNASDKELSPIGLVEEFGSLDDDGVQLRVNNAHQRKAGQARQQCKRLHIVWRLKNLFGSENILKMQREADRAPGTVGRAPVLDAAGDESADRRISDNEEKNRNLNECDGREADNYKNKRATEEERG
jgi:hypothetical protein